MAGARLGQGIGVGIYSARIGIAAMKVCRPVEFSKDKQPKASSVIRPMIKNLKSMFSPPKSDKTGNTASADMA
jgi:putative membrane protein